ncbi:MAG: hypothetical protein MJ071_06095 [Oscillospiraceae bacterium]|nr:hypothetical protein [Oscillospiraceae bacterium]
MEWAILVIIAIAWLLSPIVLLPIVLFVRKKLKRRDILLTQLYLQNRIHFQELQEAGIPANALNKLTPVQTGISSDKNLETAQKLAEFAAESSIATMQLQNDIAAAEKAVPSVESPAAATPAAEHAAETVLPAEEAAEEASISEVAAKETLVPITEHIPGEAAAAEPEKEQPAFTAEQKPQEMVPQAAPQKEWPQQVSPEPSRLFRFSPVSVLLTVGVVLVVAASFLFVRSAWGTLTDVGRLMTLAAGSVLFFGTSALARRIWHLERTSMAFFTLGSAFFPVSIWAAGYFHLLGSGLSGPDNPWLFALAFCSFTIVAACAVKLYRQVSWCIASLCGMTLSYFAFAIGIGKAIQTVCTPHEKYDTQLGDAVFLLALSLFAAAIIWVSRPLRKRLSYGFEWVIEPFALAVSILFTLFMVGTIFQDHFRILGTVALFISMTVYFAPAITDRLKGFSAPPAALLAIGGFMSLFNAFKTIRDMFHGLELSLGAFVFVCCAIVWAVMLMIKGFPDPAEKGHFLTAIALSLMTDAFLIMGALDGEGEIWMIPLLVLILMVLTIVAGGKQPVRAICCLVAADCIAICVGISNSISLIESAGNSIAALAMMLLSLLAFAAFFVTRRYRTVLSDLAFPILIGAGAFALMDPYNSAEAQLHPGFYVFVITGIALSLLFWYLALEKDEPHPAGFLFASLVPAALMFTVCITLNYVKNQMAWCIWSVVSFALGFATYYTTKKRFHTVRKALFSLLIVPPALWAVLHFDTYPLKMLAWTCATQLIAVAALFLVWRIFSNHGFRSIAGTAFGTAVILMCEASFLVMKEGLHSSFPACVMVSGMLVLLFSAVAGYISKEAIRFVGSRSFGDAMQLIAPCTALLLSFLVLYGLNENEWSVFFWLYCAAVCLLSWLVSRPHHLIMPCVSTFSLLICLEALRVHLYDDENSARSFAAAMVGALVLTILFPYMGYVLREAENNLKKQRRSWSLTLFGGAVPLWVLTMTMDLNNVCYDHTEERWLLFLVPILIGGFILHFVPQIESHDWKRRLIAAASGCGLLACWIQPMFDVDGTYLENKLHLLPLIAFGVLIQKLYGQKTGSKFLFSIGVYAMIRLMFCAFDTEAAEDLLTFLAMALIVTIGSFYVKQKKWFLLGVGSLILVALYLQSQLFSGVIWWAYLLIAGLVLIIVGAANETLKQRGESLKTKAGRLWNEWEW